MQGHFYRAASTCHLCVVCSVRKDQQQIAKAEFCDIVVSLFLDKWLSSTIFIRLVLMLMHLMLKKIKIRRFSLELQWRFKKPWARLAKGLLSRFVYCKWKVKRIPKSRWNRPVFLAICLVVEYAISGCRRKNYWVSSNIFHIYCHLVLLKPEC